MYRSYYVDFGGLFDVSYLKKNDSMIRKLHHDIGYKRNATSRRMFTQRCSGTDG